MKNYFLSGLLKVVVVGIVFSFFADLCQAQTRLIGATAYGGDQFGTIFSILPGATSLYSVKKIDGIAGGNPLNVKFVEGTNGKFYGITSTGGVGNVGVICEYDPLTDTYSAKHSFLSELGEVAVGSMILADNGKLIGVTQYGGATDEGVIFEYDYSTDTYTEKINLTWATGANPVCELVKAANGKFYGIAFGGANGEGVVFEYDYSTNTYTKKTDLLTINAGPLYGGMTEAPNGKLYGATSYGGLNGAGAIFEYDYTNNIFIKKFDLATATGKNAAASLLLADNGKFYGTTTTGGVNNGGVIFEYDYLTNSYIKKIDFSPADGIASQGALTSTSNGTLYGTTSAGGLNGAGVIFEYDYTNNIYQKKFDFTDINGSVPQGTLVTASNNKLYGTTNMGGTKGVGVIYEYDPATNTYNKKKDFSADGSGSTIFGALVHASNGKLYCAASAGGTNDLGSIIEYDYTTDTYLKKIDLIQLNGANPAGTMIEAANGKLLGMTQNGGINNAGVIYEYDYSTNTYTKKIDLLAINGRSPQGSLLKASNGKFYGLTFSGGVNDRGVLFEYDYASNIFTKLLDFNSTTGINGSTKLIQAANGKLYGSTVSGGANNAGLIFEYDYTTNTYTKKIDLVTATGRYLSGFIEVPGNKLYGVSTSGGAHSEGVIFEYDYITNVYTDKFDLTIPGGSHPTAPLTLSSENGKLYGVTAEGGDLDDGTIFEYDYTANVYSVKKSLVRSVTGYYSYQGLIEINLTTVPLTLLDFKATKSASNALLTWKTSNEINSDHIDIERSANGNDFSFLGSVTAAGNSSTTRDYSFTDDKVLPAENFFRLKFVGTDGKIKYSEVRTILFDKEDVVVVYPNPLHSQLDITFTGLWLNQPVKLSLFNQLGQQVWSKQIDRAKQTENFGLNKIMSGSYILKLEQQHAGTLYKRIEVVK